MKLTKVGLRGEIIDQLPSSFLYSVILKRGRLWLSTTLAFVDLSNVCLPAISTNPGFANH